SVPAPPTTPNRPRSGRSIHDFQIEGYLEFEDLRDGASGFGGGRRLLDLRLVGSVRRDLRREHALRERKILESDLAGRLDRLRRDAAFAELSPDRHAEAARVGGRDELFRVRPRRPFEAGLETVRRFFDRAAGDPELPFAFLETPFPYGVGATFHASSS